MTPNEEEGLTQFPRPSRRLDEELDRSPPSIRRRGAVSSGVLARFAFAFSLIALFLVLFRDPLGPIYRFNWNAFGSGLEGYDFSSPSGALKSELKMQANNDFRAAIELSRRLGGRLAKEKFNTLEIKKEVEVQVPEERRRARLNAKKGGKTRPVKLLFITYKRDGESRNSVESFEKDEDTGFWKPAHVLSYEIEDIDKELAKEMRDWEKE